MSTNQAPAVSQSADPDRQEWVAAMAKHAKYEAFRHRMHNFVTNMETMRESLQINSRIAGSDTDAGRGMAALSQQMLEKTDRIKKGFTKLDGLYADIGRRKPLIEAHLEPGASSDDEPSAQIRVASDLLNGFARGIDVMDRMWDSLMACSRRAQMYLNMARNQGR
ncbi:hypothetical protein FVEG_13451 [Fusarium verticillioides 7600]|uniref:Uncharacterized protein n=1 Tax=Gibberella moniliformis (strain M3125 / FGSC 7600) TaxID=334819 RepID=W7MVX0_GIBM7|nr:hypothetical protein FVEG_13451 [Fusarium verticillioides 7600]EWG55453.1 hypothetical protein FVEG_13451 [Fusarium verticillioides 7600]